LAGLVSSRSVDGRSVAVADTGRPCNTDGLSDAAKVASGIRGTTCLTLLLGFNLPAGCEPLERRSPLPVSPSLPL
jgi:hypothetical protein